MKKRVAIALSFVLLLGLIGVFVLRYLTLSNKLPASPIISTLQNQVPFLAKVTGAPVANGQVSATVNGVTYIAISKIPEYQITSQNIDSSQLQTSLQNLNLLPLSSKDFIEYTVLQSGQFSNRIRKADYKTIRVTFLPASQLPSDYSTPKSFPLMHLLDEEANGRIANGFFAGVSNGDTFDISVYIDPVAAAQFKLSPSQYLSSSFLESLFFNFDDQQIQSFSSPSQTYGDTVKDISHPIFNVKSITSELPSFSLQALENLIIPQAYAQTCGSVTCGRAVAGHSGTCSGITVITKTCSNNGFTCMGDPDCAPYGTCQSHTSTQNPGGSCLNNADCAATNAGTCIGATPYSCVSVGSGSCSMMYSNSDLECRPSCSGGCYIGQCGAPTCTWGAWSTCSATCGGGTQTRTSSCGATQTQACNSQSCCGDGTCNSAIGESCSTCTTDCGVCSGSGPRCGDGTCNNGESCSSCAKDCGACKQTCTPSCTTACGQANGCGGTCSNADVGAPAAPTDQNPSDASSVVTSNGDVTIGWDVMDLADLYEVEVYPTGTVAGQECTAANTHCPTPSSANNYTFTPDVGVSSYTWRVRAINSTCSPTSTGAWTAPISFTFGGGFSGNIYQDDGGTAAINPATGLCESSSAPLLPAPAGTTVQANWSGNTTPGVITGSSYSISNVGYDPNSVVTITPPAGYRCSCPAGCSYSGVSVPLGNVHFYLTTNPVGWWQTSNGYIYGGTTSGVAIQSEIPLSCFSSGTCTAALSQYDSANTLGSDSTSISGGGSIDSTADPTTQYSYLNESQTNSHAEGMALNGPREDYTYFSQLYGITANSTVDFAGDKPTSPPDNNGAYYANGDVTINNPWTLNTADSYVVFVNGNLTVTQPILVAKGAFLAFIVKGNIIFDKSLGSNSSNNPIVAGVFVADGQIITQSNQPGDDLKFVGEGSFIGWTGVQLQRNFNNANSARGNTEPIETFNYRPDFLLTVPTQMTKPLYLWQETN